jgi:lipopolysaccharide export system protein LptA
MIRAAALALAVTVLAAPLAAQENLLTPGLQVKIGADSLVIEEAKKQATFSGNVAIVREGMTVKAEEVVVTYGSGIDDFQSFVATGNVFIQTAGQTATGEQAEFDPQSQILRLTGKVMVRNAAGSMGGAELTVNLATNETTFKAGEGQRVTGVFTPQ